MIRLQNDFVPNGPVRIYVGVVTVLTVLGLTYFTVMGLMDPAALVPGGGTDAARTFAAYMSTRNVILGAAAIALLVLRAWRALGLVLALNAGVQILDAVLGVARADIASTVGPALISVALITAVAVLYRQQPAAVSQPA